MGLLQKQENLQQFLCFDKQSGTLRLRATETGLSILYAKKHERTDDDRVECCNQPHQKGQAPPCFLQSVSSDGADGGPGAACLLSQLC